MCALPSISPCSTASLGAQGDDRPWQATSNGALLDSLRAQCSEDGAAHAPSSSLPGRNRGTVSEHLWPFR